MGIILKYTCRKCGFVADDLALGPGFCGDQFAFVCQDCKNVMSRPAGADGKIPERFATCHFCGGSNLVRWDHKCPKCGNEELDAEDLGMWD